MQQPLEEYLEKLKTYDYTHEQLEAVKEFRKDVEHVPWEQYRGLIDMKLLNRTRKLKKIRNIYFKYDKFWVLNHYHKRYEYIGEMHSEEFLAERTAKEESYKAEVLENRRKKKEAKQKTVEVVTVKPKRKRIGK